MSLAMRARVTPVVIVIRAMMGPHGRRENRAPEMDAGIIITTIMIMTRVKERGRAKREPGVRMRMRRCLSLRAVVRRIRDRMESEV